MLAARADDWDGVEVELSGRRDFGPLGGENLVIEGQHVLKRVHLEDPL